MLPKKKSRFASENKKTLVVTSKLKSIVYPRHSSNHMSEWQSTMSSLNCCHMQTTSPNAWYVQFKLHNYNDLEWLQLFPGFLGVFFHKSSIQLFFDLPSLRENTTVRPQQWELGRPCPCTSCTSGWFAISWTPRLRQLEPKILKSDTAIIWIPNWQSQNGSLERTSVVGIPDFLPV